MFKIKNLLLIVALTSCPYITAHAGADDDETELAGDIVTALMPLTAIAFTIKNDDVEGRAQLFRNLVFTQTITSVLRYGIGKTTDLGTRPNGHPYGFPSGHTSFMVANATFLQKRYGWKYGVPAFLASGYVAWVRVETDHHRWRDVIAAAGLSYGLSQLWVTPQDASYIAPTIGPDWLGLRWQRSF